MENSKYPCVHQLDLSNFNVFQYVLQVVYLFKHKIFRYY